MVKKLIRITWIAVLLSFVLMIGLSGGIILDRKVLAANAAAESSTAVATRPELGLISEAWNVIYQNYVERSTLKPQQLVYGAISGMVDALGDTGHSRFLTPEMITEENNFTNGSFEGIGAEVEMKDGHVVVVAPIDGSPAQKAGVQPGYIMLKVDGVDVAGMSLEDTIQRVLGPAGTQVTITFQDPKTGEIRDLTITRARIQLNNVTWQMIPGTHIAHLRIAGFSNGVTNELVKALKDIQAQNAAGIILDLRNNPGGLLSEAVGVTSQFLKDGTVLEEKNAQGQVKKVPVEPGGIATDIPLVVLVNNGTASAAEIVSGALQDAGRASLIGETTFGTGTVLNQYSLSDKSAILLATEEWLTPKGRVIWHQGIQPDTTVSLPASAEPLTPEAERGMTAAQFQATQDTQLLKALAALTQAAK
jgi:carboxyl-terminal processing protease